MREKDTSNADRTVAILMDFLFQENILKVLLGSKENKLVMRRIRDLQVSLSREETNKLTKRLVAGLGKETEYWNVDRRDGALALLPHFLNMKVDFSSLTSTYIDAVLKLDSNADPLGPVYSLLETGIILAPHIKSIPQSQLAASSALTILSQKFQCNPYWQPAESKYDLLMKKLKPIPKYRQS